MTDVVVSVRGLTARAGGVPLVRDVTVEVGAGEVVTLFGPSGGGKTTIAAAIAGVDRPGIDVEGTREVTGRVGYLPQHAASTLNPARRVGAALGELVRLRHGREPKARHRQRVAEVLDRAAFDGSAQRLLRKFPFEFSGGQRTRLALAQVLTTEPAVLVLDEPTAGLHSLARAQLLDQLDALRRTGIAMVLVTHDPFVARRISDRVLGVRDGRLNNNPEFPESPPIVPASGTGDRGRAVELREVSLAHRLQSVDLTAHRGEFLGVIGVSGAGKSSIAHCIIGLARPDHGDVFVSNQRFPLLRKRSRAQLAHVQYVWQESAGSFRPRRSIVDQVAATAVRLRGLDAAQAQGEALTALTDLGLGRELAWRHPAELSGGQLQRAAVARALLAHPAVLVCDEATTGLDGPLARRTLDYIDAYRAEHGATVVNISHDVGSQLHRADRIAVIDNGRVAEVDSPQNLLTKPATTILRELLASEDITLRS